jgi:hypothetical protein
MNLADASCRSAGELDMHTDVDRTEFYAAQIGPKNQEYYLEKFARIDESDGGFIPLWNWAAFLFSAPWALYRKMYAVFFAAVAAGVLWEAIVAVLQPSWPLGNLFYFAAWVFFGLYGNALYYRHASKIIEKTLALVGDADRAALEIGFKGGVHRWVAPVFILGPFLAGVFAGIFIPAYQDATIRAQVSVGLRYSADTQAAVSAHYEATGSLPADNASAGLPLPERMIGDYVSSVRVDHGVVVITFGNKAAERIQGRTLELVPEVQPDNSLGWECGSQTIRPMHLPAQCRMPL